MKADNYIIPMSMVEAIDLVKLGGKVLGGGAFSVMSKAKVDTIVDISNLNLSYINEVEDGVEIGSMTTLRDIQLSSILNDRYDGVFNKCISEILGIQLRNIATIGGSICGKYGFSDIITVLLPLNPVLKFYNYGEISLNDYLDKSVKGDILEKIILTGKCRSSFKSIKKAKGDFAILNCSIGRKDNTLNIAIGARPGVSKMFSINIDGINNEDIINNCIRESYIIELGTNREATKEYRECLRKVLINRCVVEVL
ncbi:MAG: FAD binding domain-containing protein [Clostridium sp.]